MDSLRDLHLLSEPVAPAEPEVRVWRLTLFYKEPWNPIKQKEFYFWCDTIERAQELLKSSIHDGFLDAGPSGFTHYGPKFYQHAVCFVIPIRPEDTRALHEVPDNLKKMEGWYQDNRPWTDYFPDSSNT